MLEGTLELGLALDALKIIFKNVGNICMYVALVWDFL